MGFKKPGVYATNYLCSCLPQNLHTSLLPTEFTKEERERLASSFRYFIYGTSFFYKRNVVF